MTKISSLTPFDATEYLDSEEAIAEYLAAILEEGGALDEAAYLLRSPANAARLLKSIDSLRRGRTKEHKLVDPS